jgi:hypothetical protein
MQEAKQDRIPVRSYEGDPGGSKPADPETDQFNYDTPYHGGSASDRAGIKAAKEGKLVTDRDDIEQAKEEVKKELGE